MNVSATSIHAASSVRQLTPVFRLSFRKEHWLVVAGTIEDMHHFDPLSRDSVEYQVPSVNHAPQTSQLVSWDQGEPAWRLGQDTADQPQFLDEGQRAGRVVACYPVADAFQVRIR
jgi:hypothetical protein